MAWDSKANFRGSHLTRPQDNQMDGGKWSSQVIDWM